MKATDLPSNAFVKLINIGGSGSGKTGSLISLLRAGYTLRILDMDNNIRSLIELCKHENPKLLDQLDVIQLGEKFRASTVSGIEVSGQPQSYAKMVQFLGKWDDGTSPAEWGDRTVFVLDTLTAAGTAAFHWARGMNPASKDLRQWYAAAQEAISKLLEMLASPHFATNVIINSHVELIELDGGLVKGFPSSIGKALAPKVAKNYSTLLVCESKGTGTSVSRTITTVPTSRIEAKNPIPFKLDKSLPLDTGLATIFSALRSA